MDVSLVSTNGTQRFFRGLNTAERHMIIILNTTNKMMAMKTDFRSASNEYVKLEKEGCKVHMIFRDTGTEG